MGGFCFIMSNKPINYVKCARCAGWEERKFQEVCENCNNTGMCQDPKDILCNLCAGPMRPLGTHNEFYSHGLENAVVQAGYDSYHLLDMNVYKFSFCEKCLRELFIQCKIKPDMNDSYHSSPEHPATWESDQAYYEYRVWKDAGFHHQAYLDRKCNFVKDCPNTAIYTQLISGDFTEDCSCEEHKEIWKFSNSQLTKFISNVLKPFL
jgi:hypothetical protein